MKRHAQSVEELIAGLSAIETDWKDDFSAKVIAFLDKIPQDSVFEVKHLVSLLEDDFEIASTVFRIFLEKSKDEYHSLLKELFPPPNGNGKTAFLMDKEKYSRMLDHVLIVKKIQDTIGRDYTWKDIIIERLKAGRGSAIKGQTRGRFVENIVENAVRKVFLRYDLRCSFSGKDGLSTEKADFAIPSKNNPNIIIEVKAYGATGSKQTDVIGDIKKIIDEKRHDTVFILVTDGITWSDRVNDFRKLVKFQNEGFIYRIYTIKMSDELERDLSQLKSEMRIEDSDDGRDCT